FLLAEDIRLHGHGIASHSRDFPNDIGGGRFVFSVIDADSVAAFRRKERGGGSDASTSSGDEDHFIHGCCAYGEAELRSGHAKATMRIRFVDASASRRSEALSGLLPWGFKPWITLKRILFARFENSQAGKWAGRTGCSGSERGSWLCSLTQGE